MGAGSRLAVHFLSVSWEDGGRHHYSGRAEVERLDLLSHRRLHPVDPGDSTGGVGQFSFTIPQDAKSKQLRNKPVDLEDGSQGTTKGIARGLGGDGTNVSVTADSRLAALGVERKAKPFTGTLEGAFRYYLGLCGIKSGILIDTSIANIPVSLIGWSGDVWLQMKKLAVAYHAEISLVSDNVVLRPIRGRIAENYRDARVSWDVDSSSIAQSVEILYYNPEQKSLALAYPLGGWTDDVQVYQIDEGQTLAAIDIPLTPDDGEEGLGVSLTSVEQPVCVDTVLRTYSSSSVYSVSRDDGYPVKAAEWISGGGKITVAIGADTKSLVVTIKAAVGVDGGPFVIAMSAGPSDMYSSLRIVGTGVFFEKKKLTLDTAHNADEAPQEVGVTVDNEYIDSLDKAYDLGLWTSARWSGPMQTITVNTSGINRKGDTGSYRYPTFAEFNALYAGLTVGDFDAIWAGKTFEDFNDAMRAMVADDFANQAFGNVAGARVLDDDQWYRIRTATITPTGVSYTAEIDTTFDDFNEVWAGKTIDDFNKEWAGKTFADFATAPLRRTPDPVVPGDRRSFPDAFFPDTRYPA